VLTMSLIDDGGMTPRSILLLALASWLWAFWLSLPSLRTTSGESGKWMGSPKPRIEA
jgi:hypothetical protein